MDSNPQEQIEKEYPRRHHEKLKKKFTALKLVFLLSSILIILSITLWPIIKDSPEKIFFSTQSIKTDKSSGESLTMENARISGINKKNNKYSITAKDIKESLIWRKSYQNWEFLDVLARRKLNDALIRGKSFFNLAPDFSIVMNILITFFTSLYYLKISNGTFLSNIGSIPLSPYIKKRIPIGAKYYSLDELENIIHYLASLDKRLKTSSINHESAFTKFLFHAIS